MALSGFEGFEKRLELHFFGHDPIGLRNLSFKTLDQILAAVQCGVVSAVGNAHFDAYVLSESSLFIYPHKLVIKTCGTTGLLHSVPLLLLHSASHGLKLLRCKYTRGSFIFPSAQPAPHTSFKEEILFLEKNIPASLRYRKARFLPSHSSRHKWHVYCASSKADDFYGGLITIEVCMTELDRTVADRFFRLPGEVKMSGHEAGREMTQRASIPDAAGPRAFICDFAFDPCGYSMNGLHAERYSTIHVTPEEGYSYASYECVVAEESEIQSVLNKVNTVFRPGVMSVSVTGGADERIDIAGLSCRSRAEEAFSGAGIVTYLTFVSGMDEE
ncbi:S-adenosylmethionine decarboxylase proenzyme 4 [Phalaenopsis equestris]|uniref:S-adenosylmethionine decarboxylase proenzyme 4 n=1 Tax=Phalaenopsis equestris TaxID=78828 RepID=UPI0009E355B1|nr:S-adenosylmethionine decarboxylase proenzyme 4 [Phalaenopsis equestris]